MESWKEAYGGKDGVCKDGDEVGRSLGLGVGCIDLLDGRYHFSLFGVLRWHVLTYLVAQKANSSQ